LVVKRKSYGQEKRGKRKPIEKEKKGKDNRASCNKTKLI